MSTQRRGEPGRDTSNTSSSRSCLRVLGGILSASSVLRAPPWRAVVRRIRRCRRSRRRSPARSRSPDCTRRCAWSATRGACRTSTPQTQDDLFFAQGFVQAQDRLFQMDLWRRSAQGRLSEVLGPNFIERDAMTRRMQYRRRSRRGMGELRRRRAGRLPRRSCAASTPGSTLARERPPEEFVLAGWKPEAWSGRGSAEPHRRVHRQRRCARRSLPRPPDRHRRPVARAAAAGRRSPARCAGRPRSAGRAGSGRPRRSAASARRRSSSASPAPVTEGTVRGVAAAASARTGDAPGAGGAAQPDRSPARQLDHPSLRYFVHLIAPGWNVIGATAPWRPGVAEGHNDRVAWTAEPIDADTQDVYVEKLNPANPRQVEDAGRGSISTCAAIESPCAAARRRSTSIDRDDAARRGRRVRPGARHLAFAIRWSGQRARRRGGTGARWRSIARRRRRNWSPRSRTGKCRRGG